MAFGLTIGEAASRLGVGRPRVYQLVTSGALAAEKAGGIWMVDVRSVEARLAASPKAGRPAKRQGPASKRSICSYTLMNRTHEVLSFRYDSDKAAFFDSDCIFDADRAPVGLLSPRGKKATAQALAFWWRHRSIPVSREGMAAKLVELGFEAPYQIPFKSLGLSLSDQYWVRPEGSNIRWEDVNFFDNEFVVLRAGKGWLDEVGLDSPDNTSEGELPKKWICENGKRLLVKGGSVLNQEPFNEVVATELHRRLLQPHEYVPYRLQGGVGGTVCLCEDFVSSAEEYIPAYYVRQIARQPNHRSDYQHYLECCAALGVEDAEGALAKMIVCDDILGGFDRHWRNFGLVRNVETLECRVAPLFDSGGSLWCTTPTSSLAADTFTFETKPFYSDANRQLRLVNDYSWFSVGALEGFAEEVGNILAGNRALEDRVDLVVRGVQERIERIVRML